VIAPKSIYKIPKSSIHSAHFNLLIQSLNLADLSWNLELTSDKCVAAFSIKE
jgi:hypothetical protein